MIYTIIYNYFSSLLTPNLNDVLVNGRPYRGIICIDFQYHMLGSGIGKLDVYALLTRSGKTSSVIRFTVRPQFTH